MALARGKDLIYPSFLDLANNLDRINRSSTAKMPTSFTSSYLLPAIVLNPLVLLHGLNTFASHFIPSAISTAASHSPHKWIEFLGPPGNQDPHLDMHANNQLCWRYTILMVFLQVLAYGKVSGNRETRRNIRAARKAERDLARMATEKQDPALTTQAHRARQLDVSNEIAMNGNAKLENGVCLPNGTIRAGSDSDEGTTDTSEEETIV